MIEDEVVGISSMCGEMRTYVKFNRYDIRENNMWEDQAWV
jgi:hypothetical protein